MLSINELYYICENRCQRGYKDVIFILLHHLKGQDIHLKYESGKLKLEYLDWDYDNVKSCSAISGNYHNCESSVEKNVMALLQYQHSIEKIIQAINEIILDEDRCIFIERYYLDWRVDKILQHHFIGHHHYYDALQRAEKQFCLKLRINMGSSGL